MNLPDQQELRLLPLGDARTEVRDWFIQENLWTDQALVWALLANRLGLVEASDLYAHNFVEGRRDVDLVREAQRVTDLQRQRVEFTEQTKDMSDADLENVLAEELAFMQNEARQDNIVLRRIRWELARRKSLKPHTEKEAST